MRFGLCKHLEDLREKLFWQTQTGNIRFPTTIREIKYFTGTRGKNGSFMDSCGSCVCIQQMPRRGEEEKQQRNNTLRK